MSVPVKSGGYPVDYFFLDPQTTCHSIPSFRCHLLSYAGVAHLIIFSFTPNWALVALSPLVFR